MTPVKSVAPQSGQKPLVMSESDLRGKLRPIFDKFDEDQSGTVSVAEMGKMVKLLKLQLTVEQIQAMVAEADADGSGEVEFDEFVLVLRKQMEGGGTGGALLNVVSEAGSMFGWLNPLSWFATTQAAVPDTPPAPVTPAKTPPGTAKSRGPVPSLSPQQGPPLSPSPRTPTVTATSTPTGTPSSKGRIGIVSRSARKRLTADREADLRGKLRPIFDKFDEDQSGTVSVAEMGKMVKLLKLQLTVEQIQAMVAEADADGSGEVEFDEFVLVLRKQMEGGGAGGALLNVVGEASSTFGWLNPLSWFAESPAAAPPRSRGSPIHRYGGGEWSFKRGVRWSPPDAERSHTPQNAWLGWGSKKSNVLAQESLWRGLPPQPQFQTASSPSIPSIRYAGTGP